MDSSEVVVEEQLIEEEALETEAVEEGGELDKLESEDGGTEPLGGGEGDADEETAVYKQGVAAAPDSPLEPKGFYQTSLYTCSAAYSYGINVPPGTTGMTPTVTLSYNSQGAGGKADIVGTGWSLSQHYIKRDVNYTPDNTADDEYTLVLNGESHDLVYVETENRYHTKIESYLLIEKKTDSTENQRGEYWLIKTKDGVTYRFGYRNDSETKSSVRDYVWQWNLDQIEDLHGNHIYYYYTEDNGAVYPQKIEYNNDKKRRIEFILEDRPDISTVYDQGSRITQTQRLKEIQVKADNNLVRKYVLEYINQSMGSSTGKTLLKSITEYGSDGVTTLPPTKFTYQKKEAGWISNTTWKSPEQLDDIYGDMGVRFTDLNGDGLEDVLVGRDDYYIGEYKAAWINNGQGWTQDNSWAPPVYFALREHLRPARNDMGYRLADVNGDGLVDIIRDDEAYVNTGSGWIEDDTWKSPEKFIDYLYFRDQGARLTDVNGDGLVDIIVSRYYYIDAYNKGSYKAAWINNGSGWTQNNSWAPPTYFVESYETGWEYRDWGVRLVDVNADGLVDMIKRNSASAQTNAWINNGSGWQLNDIWKPPATFTGGWDLGARLADVNGDGLTDITQCYSEVAVFYPPTGCWTWINNGSGWTQNNTWNSPTQFTVWKESEPQLADVNGDGLVDIISYDKHTSWINKGSKPDLLIEIENEIGGTTNITYLPSTRYDNPHLGSAYQCVESITSNNGIEGTHQLAVTTRYNYSGGLYDFEDKEFRGFKHATVKDALNTTTDIWYHQDDALKGRENKTETRDKDGKPYTKTENKWDYTIEDGIYKTYLLQTDAYTYDGAGTNPKNTRTEYEYDIYGNVNKTSSLGDTTVTGDERYGYIEYNYNPGKWIVNKPKHSYLMDSDDTTKLSEAWYYYDNQGLNDPPTKGDLTKDEVWLDTGANPINQYGYDAYGNQVNATDANGHTTRYVYDITHTFPEQTINAKGHTYSATYDLGTGNPLSTTDPNGHTIIYEYDVFGRPLKEIKPYDSSSYPTTSYEYMLDGTAPEGVKVSLRTISGQTGTLDAYTFVDGSGRVIQTKADSEDTNKQITVNIFYDELGQVKKQSMPHHETYNTEYTTPRTDVRNMSFEYDPIGRNIIVWNPDNTQKTTEYDHWTVTSTDENSHTRKYYLDAYGKITQVDEHNNGETYATTYRYNGRNELVNITDNEGNIFQFQYDSLGRKTWMDDPDMGTWTYTYDLVGNIISQTDNRETTTNFEYDELNRITKKDNPVDGDITYTYDTEKIGTLSEINDTIGSTHYYYDNRLRPIEEERIIEGIEWATETSYDSADRITSQKYPTGEVINYSFNNQGETETAGEVIDNIDYNAMNKVTKKEYGNNVYTEYTYNEDDFRLNKIYTPSLQDLRYTYDNIGNVHSIEDNLKNKTQVFGYDDLDRLTSALEEGYNHAYSYSSIGNLISFSNSTKTTTYTYGENAGPHAVTESTENPICLHGGITTCGINHCCGAVDGICPLDFDWVECNVTDPDCPEVCADGGFTACGVDYCCGASDGICPTDFDNVNCTTWDPDCSSGGISTCQGVYLCGETDGVCPEHFDNVTCSTFDIDCV